MAISTYPATMVSICLLRPQSRGRITLRSSSPADPPKILARFLSQDIDLQTMLGGLKLARKVIGTPPVADVVVSERMPGAKVKSDDEINAFIRVNAQSVYHGVGSCKMGIDPMAVVDPRLRVHGVDGPQGRRCVDHADDHLGQHQRALDHDRREAADMVLADNR